MRKIIYTVNRQLLKELDEKQQDLNHWLKRTPAERVGAVTRLVRLSLKPGQRMDKTIVTKRTLHS